MPAAGQIIRALDFAGSASLVDGTDELGFTNTAYDPGSNPVGVAFVAPTSGKVKITFHCRAESNTAGTSVHTSVAVRTGGTIGSGTTVRAATDPEGLQSQTDASAGANQRSSAATFRPVTGLTAGSTYNAQIEFRMSSAGNGDVFDRSIVVEPMF